MKQELSDIHFNTHKLLLFFVVVVCFYLNQTQMKTNNKKNLFNFNATIKTIILMKQKKKHLRQNQIK